MNDPGLRLMSPADAGISARVIDTPLRPVQVTAISNTQGNHTPETGAGADNKQQERLADAVKQLNGRMHEMQRSLRFSVDEDSGRIVVKVIDQDTDEVIRQIPSEEMLIMMKHISEYDGLIFDDRA